MDSRADRRFVVDKDIECQIDGRVERAFLYDLSISGCMIEISKGQFEVGNALVLKLTHFIEAYGQVVWQIGENAGVRFEEQLPDVLVEKLGFQPITTPFEDILPRDRFGRLLPSLPAYQERPNLGL
ncbi:MAG: PilZ domain-containing protein [Novosphingobium sp.]|nr:PilZ domain-containing protein [Novosphingobium sp.]